MRTFHLECPHYYIPLSYLPRLHLILIPDYISDLLFNHQPLKYRHLQHPPPKFHPPKPLQIYTTNSNQASST